MVTKDDLKQEIEQLDEGYLELVFRLLQQFPHLQKTPSVDALRCSRSIDYGVNDENNDDALPFAEVEDAASFGRNLRVEAWQRANHV